MAQTSKKKIKDGKRFYPVVHFRLSEKNNAILKKIKKGTWNHTFNLLIAAYANETMRRLSRESLDTTYREGNL